jgi:hypothetical protein
MALIPRPIHPMPRTASPRPSYSFASPAWQLQARGHTPAQINRTLARRAATLRAVSIARASAARPAAGRTAPASAHSSAGHK